MVKDPEITGFKHYNKIKIMFFSEKFPCDAGFTVFNRMEIFQLEFIKKFSSGRLISPEIRFR